MPELIAPLLENPRPIGVTTRAERREAIRQADRINAVNRKSDVFIRQYTNAVRRAALAAWRQGKRIDLSDSAIDKIINELVGLSLLAYMQGTKHFKRVSHSNTLSLSSFDREVSRIAQGFTIDVGKLSVRLKSLVGPRVRESLFNVKDRINDTLSELSSGRVTTREGTRILSERLEEMGVTPKSSSYVETLVRTHSQLSYNAAQHVELDKDTEIWGYKYVTVGDDRVRPEHEKLDGLVKEKDNPIWKTIWPPNGWNCRCQVLALYDPEPTSRLPRSATQLIDPAFRFNPGIELA